MADGNTFDHATRGVGVPNADHGVGSNHNWINREAPKVPRVAPHKRKIDPAEEAMNSNHNLSPPIHFERG